MKLTPYRYGMLTPKIDDCGYSFKQIMLRVPGKPQGGFAMKIHGLP